MTTEAGQGHFSPRTPATAGSSQSRPACPAVTSRPPRGLASWVPGAVTATVKVRLGGVDVVTSSITKEGGGGSRACVRRRCLLIV
jgi:hypothetical protein